MRKLKLFLMACALMGAGTSWAQATWTDKTDAITNPSFETDNAISDLTKGDATAQVAPTGWTVTHYSGNTNMYTQQWGTANSSSKIQGVGTSHAPSDGNNYYFIRFMLYYKSAVLQYPRRIIQHGLSRETSCAGFDPRRF